VEQRFPAGGPRLDWVELGIVNHVGLPLFVPTALYNQLVKPDTMTRAPATTFVHIGQTNGVVINRFADRNSSRKNWWRLIDRNEGADVDIVVAVLLARFVSVTLAELTTDEKTCGPALVGTTVI